MDCFALDATEGQKGSSVTSPRVVPSSPRSTLNELMHCCTAGGDMAVAYRDPGLVCRKYVTNSCKEGRLKQVRIDQTVRPSIQILQARDGVKRIPRLTWLPTGAERSTTR